MSHDMRLKLDEAPARKDLTDRECSKILGATIGGLVQMADVDNVLRAVVWWAEHPEVVKSIAKAGAALERSTNG